MTDVSALLHLADHLDAAAGRLADDIDKVVAKGMLNVKEDARKRVSGHPSWKRLANTIVYRKDAKGYVIGYALRGQGKLGHIAEFGSARHGAHPALLPAMEAELPNIYKYAAEAARKALS